MLSEDFCLDEFSNDRRTEVPGSKETGCGSGGERARELVAERNILKDFIAHAPTGIARMDAQLVVQDANYSFGFLTGCEPDWLVGRPVADFIGEPLLAPIGRAVAEGVPYQASGLALEFSGRKGKGQLAADVTIWPLGAPGSESSGAFLVIADASERVKLMRQREDALSTVAHDLRVPLVGLSRMLGLLKTSKFGALTAEQVRVVAALKSSTDALLSLVTNFVESCRLEAGGEPFHFQLVDLECLAGECLEELSHLAEMKELVLEKAFPDGLECVWADRLAAKRVLANLIHNAIKFSKPGGRVEVGAEMAGHAVRVHVRDSGPGIAPGMLGRLFERFSRGGEASRYANGTGLGLYLSRKIIEAHQGRIWCETRLDFGSTFFFTLSTVGPSAHKDKE